MTNIQKTLIIVSSLVLITIAGLNITINNISNAFSVDECYGICKIEDEGKDIEGVYEVHRIGNKLITKSSKVFTINYNGIYNYESSEIFRGELDLLANRVSSNDVIIININSMGGSVEACESDHHIIKSLKEETGAYIVGATDSFADSCGYYALSAVDYIYTSAGANVGNIGVVYDMSDRPYELIIDMMGGDINRISSTDIKGVFAGKDMPFEDKEKIVNVSLRKAYARFIGDVESARGHLINDKDLAYSGYPLSAREALRIGLTDEIKDRRTLVREMHKKGYVITNIYTKKKKSGLSSFMAGATSEVLVEAINELKK